MSGLSGGGQTGCSSGNAMSEKNEQNAADEDNPEIDRDIVYYYSRERRLSRASQTVRDFDDHTPAKQSAVKKFFGNRGNFLIFISILMICIMAYLTNQFSGSGNNEFILGNNRISVTITQEETINFFSLVKTIPNNASVYTGTVDIAISPVRSGNDGEEPPVMTHRIFFTYNITERFMVSLPFDGASFIVVMQTENETLVRTVHK